jgi:predicted RNase H-like HicB family nuclease
MKFSIAIEAGTRKSAFGVVVPDIPGCFSAGDTVEEAFDNAREAIESHLEILSEEGKDLPKIKPLSEWMAHREYKGWTWGVVDVPVERFFGPAEKINITIPGRLLKQIDEFAKSRGQTRSGFLANAALEVMRK